LRQLVVRHLQHRLIVIQGFLHSDDSGRIKVELKRNRETAKDRLIVEGAPRPGVKKIIHRVIDKLGKSFRGLGYYPIKQAVEIPLPGRGYHYGGSFPMRAKPGALESDISGRLPGFSRTHVVDASVFPSIAATTITLTAMANAHRIGTMVRHE
jgi:choline dehydrogenase-like flavoprotein